MKWKRSKKGLNEIKQASNNAKEQREHHHNQQERPGEAHSHMLGQNQIPTGPDGKPLSHHILGHSFLPGTMHPFEHHPQESQLEEDSDMDDDDYLDVENNNASPGCPDDEPVSDDVTYTESQSFHRGPEDQVTVLGQSGIPPSSQMDILPEDLSKRRLLMSTQPVTAH